MRGTILQRLFATQSPTNLPYNHARAVPFSTDAAKIPAFPTPDLFDILLTDVNNSLIHSIIAPKLQVQHLGDSLHRPASIPIHKTLNGVMIGNHLPVFIALPVQIGMIVKDIVFLVDTGVPYTYLSKKINSLT